MLFLVVTLGESPKGGVWAWKLNVSLSWVGVDFKPSQLGIQLEQVERPLQKDQLVNLELGSRLMPHQRFILLFSSDFFLLWQHFSSDVIAH